MKRELRELRELRQLVKMDRVIHEPSRLLIITALYRVAKMDFVSLQKKWNFTKGNLSSHLAKLEAAGYVAIEKGFKGKYPRTVCGLTKKGREALADYARKLKCVSEVAEDSSGTKG